MQDIIIQNLYTYGAGYGIGVAMGAKTGSGLVAKEVGQAYFFKKT